MQIEEDNRNWYYIFCSTLLDVLLFYKLCNTPSEHAQSTLCRTLMQTMHRHSEDFWKACQLLITDDVFLDQVDGARRRTMSQELCAEIYSAIEEQVIKWNAQQLVANSLSDSSRR